MCFLIPIFLSSYIDSSSIILKQPVKAGASVDFDLDVLAR
jgi:hypothetical protein